MKILPERIITTVQWQCSGGNSNILVQKFRVKVNPRQLLLMARYRYNLSERDK